MNGAKDPARERRAESGDEDGLGARRESMRGAIAALLHEINQPLAATSAYLTVARRMLDKQPETSGDLPLLLEKAATQTLRASRLVGSLRDLLNCADWSKPTMSLHGLINQALVALRAENALENIRIAPELAAPRDDVLADSAQITLALTAVLRAAVSTIQTAGRQDLVIRTSNPDPATVRVDIAFAGVNAQKPSDPGFELLTVEKAKALGPGLLSSLMIIEGHDGRVWAASNRGGGVLYGFTLPLRDLEFSA